MELIEYMSNYLITNNLGSDFTRKGLLALIKKYSSKDIRYDFEKIEDWLSKKNLPYKSNPIAFLEKAFIEELEIGTFEITPKVCDIHGLIIALAENAIAVKENASCYLSVMFNYLINEGYASQEEIVNANHKAVELLAKKGKTTDDFIELWKKSKLCKERGVAWGEIDKKAKIIVQNCVSIWEGLDD